MRRRVVPSAVVGALLLSVVVAPPVSASPGQVVEDKTSISLEQIVAALVGPGVTVSNVSYTGDDRAVGTFAGMSALGGITQGVALSTGAVRTALPGPNTDLSGSTSFQTAGDGDVDALIDGITYDASAVEFDFVPRTDSLSIDYAFGSEEYNEYVGSDYNDAFAFFVNGQNCAVVDDDPVSINSINGGVRPHLFVDNTSSTADTALNGFTHLLTCVAPVDRGAVNHAKLVIADVADTIYDSTVVIEQGGLFSNTPPSAGDLSFAMASGATVSVVFAGSDADGDALTYAVDSPPAHGDVASIENGATYTPQAGFVGADTFTYTVSDGIAVSRTYTVTIDVTAPAPVNSTPVVSDVSYTVVQGVETAVPVVAIDSDGDQLEYAVVEFAAHGTLRGTGHALSYTSAADYVGADRFSVRVSDPAGPASFGHVTLDVIARPVPAVVSEAVPVFPRAPDRPLTALPMTGTSVGPAISIGVVLLVIGLGIVVFTRMRRRTRSS
jgi:hypothetical protein